MDPILSPDGRRLAVELIEGESDVWVYDLSRGTKNRLTSDAAQERIAAWTPTGDEITYASNQGGSFRVFSKGFSGGPRMLAGAAGDERPLDWSPDGRFLMCSTLTQETKTDLLYRERRADGSLGDAVVFLRTPYNETGARFSPDGRFVVYASDETGRNEVYVREFPAASSKRQISDAGGRTPRWRRDGKEIFYVEGATLVAVAVTTQPRFSSGAPSRLFEKRSLWNAVAQYDVSADGRRIFVLDQPGDEPPLSIHVAHNWFEEFRGRR